MHAQEFRQNRPSVRCEGLHGGGRAGACVVPGASARSARIGSLRQHHKLRRAAVDWCALCVCLTNSPWSAAQRIASTGLGVTIYTGKKRVVAAVAQVAAIKWGAPRLAPLRLTGRSPNATGDLCKMLACVVQRC
ncbi:unnamed protein product [Mesocestoides corti]|uniref:DUF448 domain-containing protein n=1 Tax=Mesocestoides corti TaxID=53468 RepID=A0A158QU76_MESCO|nr:unnamed protein product [Mesocestoides corti]